MDNFTFTTRPCERLQRQLHATRDAGLYRRTLALLEVARGRTVSEVAATSGVTRQALPNQFNLGRAAACGKRAAGRAVSGRLGALLAFKAAGVPEVDSVEDHVQLPRASGRGSRPLPARQRLGIPVPPPPTPAPRSREGEPVATRSSTVQCPEASEYPSTCYLDRSIPPDQAEPEHGQERAATVWSTARVHENRFWARLSDPVESF